MSLSPVAEPLVPAGAASGQSALNPAAVYLARLAAGSQRTMRQALHAIADIATEGKADEVSFPWHQLTYAHTQAIRSRLAQRYSVATTNKLLSALRGVLKESWRLGLMDAEDYHRAVDVQNLKESKLPAGRHVGAGEVAALATVCRDDPGAAGARDGAMLGMAFSAGLRISELVGLDLADVNLETGELTVRGAKGRKDRTAWLQNGALAALQDWIGLRTRVDGPLFCPISQTGEIRVSRMSSQALYERFQLRGRQAGLAQRFTPHDGRRTWIGELLDRGADIVTVQKLAGHASVSTTARYDRRGEHTKREAAGLLHFPWAERKSRSESAVPSVE